MFYLNMVNMCYLNSPTQRDIVQYLRDFGNDRETKKIKERKLLWQTAYSPRPPTSWGIDIKFCTWGGTRISEIVSCFKFRENPLMDFGDVAGAKATFHHYFR